MNSTKQKTGTSKTGTIVDTSFLSDVLNGLSSHPQKTLPSKYFYDDKGSSLFQQIMAMPEYYLTRAEMDIFQNKTEALIASLNPVKTLHYDVIELGPGDGTKTIHLLKGFLGKGYSFRYLPVDISKGALDGLTTMLETALPTLTIVAQQGDYFVKLQELKTNHHPKIILMLGSNIGNMSDAEASECIYQLGANLRPGDKIVLGADLIKPANVVLPAYSDAGGITVEFNLNLLDRINRELNGNFDRDQFRHQASYNATEGIARSFLVSKIDQTVSIDGTLFHFAENESIHTEVSRKYNDEIIRRIMQHTDIRMDAKITDSRHLFADYILVRQTGT